MLTQKELELLKKNQIDEKVKDFYDDFDEKACSLFDEMMTDEFEQLLEDEFLEENIILFYMANF